MDLAKLSQKDFAELVGLSAPRVNTMVKLGELPPPSVPQWGVVAMRAYIAILKKRVNDRGAGDEFQAERVRLTKAQANTAEHKLEVARGEYIHTDEIMRAFGNVIISFKTKLLAIPSKAGPVVRQALTNAEAKEVLDEFVKEACEDLAMPDLPQIGAYIGRDRSVDPGENDPCSLQVDATTAESDRQSVV